MDDTNGGLYYAAVSIVCK